MKKIVGLILIPKIDSSKSGVRKKYIKNIHIPNIFPNLDISP